MPVRRRVGSLQGREPEPHIFRFGDGTWSYFRGDPVYSDREAARRAWQRARRVVWAETSRLGIPGAARSYDGLTFNAIDCLRRNCRAFPFDLAEVLATLEEDRRNLDQFAATPGARMVRDFLELCRSDLDVLEQSARDFAAAPEPEYCRPSPAGLNRSGKYGDTRPRLESTRQTEVDDGL